MSYKMNLSTGGDDSGFMSKIKSQIFMMIYYLI